jgi:hypothetical protein
MRYLFIIILSMLSGLMYCQVFRRESGKQDIDSLKHEIKNSIYISAGSYIILMDANINYERMVIRLGRKKAISLFLRAGFGKWASWTSGGTGGILGANLMFLTGSSHIEAGFGAVALFNKEMYEMDLKFEPPASIKENMIYSPCINIGYRYQKPGGHFIFRAGISYPEGVYGALGVAF